MAGRFTLGIEEEFQMVNRQNRQLCSSINTILERGTPYFVEKIKPELTQSTVELISDFLSRHHQWKQQKRCMRSRSNSLGHLHFMSVEGLPA